MITKEDCINNNMAFIDGTETCENKLLKFLKENYPSVIQDTEINLAELKNALQMPVDEKTNGYGLNFIGRNFARAKYASKTKQELQLNTELSKNIDTTQNLVLKGDNLDSLKILKNHYSGKIKCIYIDPPYNTDKDEFVYPDKFDKEEREVLGFANLSEDDIARMDFSFKTKKSHNGWLSFMYPRLLLARDLLTNDGVIFISIDDNEQANLKLLCNDVFGEENFVNIVTVKTKIGGVSGSSEGKSLKDATEFLYIYCRNKETLSFNPVYKKTKLFDVIQQYKMDEKSWKYTSVLTKMDGKKLIKEIKGMKFYGYSVLETKSINTFAKEKGITEEEVYNQYANLIFRTTNAQSSVRQTVIKETESEDFPLFGCEYYPIKGKNMGQKIEVLYKSADQKQRNMVMFLSDVVSKIDDQYYYLEKISSLWEDIEYNNLTKEGDIEFQNGKKPLKLVQRALSLIEDDSDIILDFFAGSGTTGHAVMQLNAEDGGNRKFILCQIDEPIDAKKEAYKFCTENNLPPVISSITIERLKRAGEKIKKEIEEHNISVGLLEEQKKKVPDIGFKVFDSVKAPELTVDENGTILFPEILTDTISRIYNMVFTVGLDEPTQVPETVKDDCMYKIGNNYYLTNCSKLNSSDYEKALKNGKVFIDGWTADLNGTLQNYKEDVKIVF